jgi:hypothetical protein
MLRITAAMLMLTPAIASAQCLTADALSGGITVEYASGDVSHIQRQPDGSLLDAFSQTSRYSQKTILTESVDGVLETRLTVHRPDTWEADTPIIKSYDFTADSLTPYTVGMRHNGTTTWEGERYTSGQKSYLVTAYPAEPLVLGDCSYDVLRVFTYELSISDQDFYLREVKFLPALGIGIQTANSFLGLTASTAEIVNITAN